MRSASVLCHALHMRLDHVSYASDPDGYHATADRLAAALGVSPVDGGVHPRFGTRNLTFPLLGGQYLEVVEALDHPATEKAPFGRAVRGRSEAGGGWLGWVVSVEDISPVEERLGRGSVQGNRTRPDGVELRWRQIGVKGLIADPQLPFFVSWQSPQTDHPSSGDPAGVGVTGLQIAGDPHRVSDWLGGEIDDPLGDIDVNWVAPHGTPGLLAVTFATPSGPITI